MDAAFIKQIEEWTERRISNILFDSDNDDWNKYTSVFDQRIINKEHLIIIIEDSEGNKFGGYVNSKIDKNSKGRMKGMKKIDIKEPECAFKLYNQSDDCLFLFGLGDFGVYKENDKIKSYCSQYSFEYKGIENALCGKQLPNHFTPKRIIVIEMK
ncbi:trichohyalin, putative [Entamoeba histolytica]